MSNSTGPGQDPKIRVLLVDDNQTFLRVAADFLQRHDELVVVGIAQEGEEALAQTQDLQPHVILLDLDMPGSNGIEMISRLRVMTPQVRIIILTLLDSSIYRQATLAAGADDFVQKAALTTDLLPAIRRAVQADRPRQKPSVVSSQ
jgi:DNA-binding NarL/FixJ family response regulator